MNKSTGIVMTLPEGIIVFAAAVFAGALNSVAGGGSFISFPAILLTRTSSLFAGALRSITGGSDFIAFPALMLTRATPRIANATNTIALWPGSAASVGAYRRELMRVPGLVPLMVVSLVGGIIGAVALLRTPDSTFTKLLPFLLLLATLLFAFGRRVSSGLRGRVMSANLPPFVLIGLVLVLQAIVAIYGGFFGAGIGIMMLAVLSLTGMESIHEMNALKTLLATCINGTAVVTFVLAGTVLWPQAIVMVVGAILGGYFGAYFARQIDPKLVRRFVIVVGAALTAYFFFTTYLQR